MMATGKGLAKTTEAIAALAIAMADEEMPDQEPAITQDEEASEEGDWDVLAGEGDFEDDATQYFTVTPDDAQ